METLIGDAGDFDGEFLRIVKSLQASGFDGMIDETTNNKE